MIEAISPYENVVNKKFKRLNLPNITDESFESYIEEQRCNNTSDVLTYECPEIYDGKFHLKVS